MNIRNRNWAEGSSEEFEKLIGVNVSGAFHCCRAVLPTMRDNGGAWSSRSRHELDIRLLRLRRRLFGLEARVERPVRND